MDRYPSIDCNQNKILSIAMSMISETVITVVELISGLQDAGTVKGFSIWKKVLFINQNLHPMSKIQGSVEYFHLLITCARSKLMKTQIL